jgi:hypothetical protein
MALNCAATKTWHRQPELPDCKAAGVPQDGAVENKPYREIYTNRYIKLATWKPFLISSIEKTVKSGY